MRPTSRVAAQSMRELLVRGRPSPAVVRAALQRVPAQDRDAWLDLVIGHGGLPDDDSSLPAGCVPYLPCSVGTVLEAVEQADVRASDVFVDIGSGVGRVLTLVHLLTGATCLGVEIQPALVVAANLTAQQLNLSGTRCVEGDAAALLQPIASGTVFLLYCPFSGPRLQAFLGQLEPIAHARSIRVCCVDMPPLETPWLAPLPSRSTALDVYQSVDARALGPG